MMGAAATGCHAVRRHTKGCEFEALGINRQASCSGLMIIFGPVLLMVPGCLISFTLLSLATPAVIWLDLFPLFFIEAPQGFIALQQGQAFDF